jgi:2-phosphosulfolactate phosphatase
LEGSGRIHPEEVIQAILKASAAKKFFDPAKTAFNREDLDFCIKELNSPFVMKINQTKTIPTIERVFL